MKKVSVVILNYKVRDLTIKCIESVKKSSYENISIIVVDNNSDDGLVEAIKKVEGVEFVQLKENFGYSGGNNAGIKRALKEGADYIFLLNPDTVIDKGAISSMVELAQKGGDEAVIGPKIYFGDGKTIWYAGGIFDQANVLGKHRGVDQKDEGQYNKIEETEYVTGAAMFVPKDVFDKVGLFDEQYFLYYEDSDFSYRAKSAGFKLVYLPTAVVCHENAKSTGLGSPLQDYYITRNRMLFASKFLPIRTRFALFREALRNLDKPVRRKAFFDFLLGKFGKGEY